MIYLWWETKRENWSWSLLGVKELIWTCLSFHQISFSFTFLASIETCKFAKHQCSTFLHQSKEHFVKFHGIDKLYNADTHTLHIWKKTVLTSSLPLGKNLSVGKLLTLTFSTSLAVESILAITISALSLYFSPNSSQIGASFLQCPHHGASDRKKDYKLADHRKDWQTLNTIFLIWGGKTSTKTKGALGPTHRLIKRGEKGHEMHAANVLCKQPG